MKLRGVGDLVVGEMNGFVYYVRAIVYRRKSSDASSRQARPRCDVRADVCND